MQGQVMPAAAAEASVTSRWAGDAAAAAAAAVDRAHDARRQADIAEDALAHEMM